VTVHTLFVIALVSIARILERRRPIAVTPVSEVIEDWKLVSVNFALTTLLAPLATVGSGVILSALGHHAWLMVFRIHRHPGSDF
jgi:hypothetical protein